MCGICGFIERKGSKETAAPVLTNMLTMLEKRGPDDSGERLLQNGEMTIALGQRRLSIIDTSYNGHQPMIYKSKTIIYNGEVYNYAEIQKELLEKGYSFTSSSDTEVILKAYDCWGIAAFEKFNGMWAFSIYDEDTRKMILCRDRSGVKPMLWYYDGDRFLFGSELKAFSPNPNFKKEINKAAMALFFQFNYIREPHTIFKNTYKLEAGHYLEIDLNDKINITKHQYWNIEDYYSKPKLKVGEKEGLEEMERLMIKGFNYRMVADVPVGMFLSAGIDSSIVAAILQHTNGSKLKTFTIGFDENEYDEAPKAKRIAQHLGTEHNELYCSGKEFNEMLHLLPDVIDEPFGDTSVIPSMLLSRFARQQVTVALSADGGDELLCGYPGFPKTLAYYRRFSRFPSSVKRAMELSAIGAGGMLPQFSNKKYQADKLVEFLQADNSLDIYETLFKFQLNPVVKDVFGLTPETLFGKEYVKLRKNDLSSLLSACYKTFMNNEVLFKVDKATMQYSLEGREPFLDKDLVEFTAQLPDHFKINNGILKWSSKQILFKYVPKDFYDDTKRGFSPPPLQLIKHVEEKFDHVLLAELVKDGVFPENIISSISVKNVEWRTRWLVFVFLEWYKRWMKADSKTSAKTALVAA
ncbi:asparagine synthase (glutamine-hydrolyzing) [Pollutibacter soli]|uniref:asparagine synthase (glutamine-hydrolyzing) n=1 Tax=Pollutibacter soli TaxID=3034157 RepID=UPI003013F335